MHNNHQTASGLSSEKKDIVEIKLWGLYLLINSGNLYNQILESSLDRGPVEKNPQKPGRITFRFSANEWESRVKKLLYNNRIPVIVKSSLTYSNHQFIS